MKSLIFRLLSAALILQFATRAFASDSFAHFVEVRRFSAPEATQAVAVDDQYFYAIGNTVIGKYSKDNGVLSERWTASPDHPIEHLNSGIIVDGKLYCAHSNFPRYPETSSIEIWNTQTLEHIDSHSLGIYEGSLTWIDWHNNAWWAVFAHYHEKVNENPYAKDTRWTSLVRFDSKWRRTSAWTFPQEVIKRFIPHSCSGGSWGEDGQLYCTGHDRSEIYQLKLPRAGSILQLNGVSDIPITGQGFAWDRTFPKTIYGIDRARGQVVVINHSEKRELTQTKTKQSSNINR